MFGKRKKESAPAFDWTGMIPTIRASICTGEKVAGFKDANGKFHEIMLVRSDADLGAFLREYRVDEAELRKEW